MQIDSTHPNPEHLAEFRFNIVFGMKYDAYRILGALRKLPWYKENGYDQNVLKSLPTSDSLVPIINHYSQFGINRNDDYLFQFPLEEGSLEAKYFDTIMSVLEDGNYDADETYAPVKKTVLELLNPEKSKMCAINGANLQNNITIIFVSSGTGGSFYHEDNCVVINIKSRNVDEIVSTILHELIELGLNEIFDSFLEIGALTHARKERIVDLFCRDYLHIHGYKMQQIGDPSVDSFFSELSAFINIRQTLENICVPEKAEMFLA